jgi:hypothetical protein
MKRVKSFGVYQTSKVVAIMYFLITAVFMIPFGIFFNFLSEKGETDFPFGGMFFMALPFVYAILGFLITALGCFLYNITVRMTGGIEMEVETTESTGDEIIAS